MPNDLPLSKFFCTAGNSKVMEMGLSARKFLQTAGLNASEFKQVLPFLNFYACSSMPYLPPHRIGFHRPPYNSVHHLHLHIIGPHDTITEKYMFCEPIFAPVSLMCFLNHSVQQFDQLDRLCLKRTDTSATKPVHVTPICMMTSFIW